MRLEGIIRRPDRHLVKPLGQPVQNCLMTSGGRIGTGSKESNVEHGRGRGGGGRREGDGGRGEGEGNGGRGTGRGGDCPITDYPLCLLLLPFPMLCILNQSCQGVGKVDGGRGGLVELAGGGGEGGNGGGGAIGDRCQSFRWSNPFTLVHHQL